MDDAVSVVYRLIGVWGYFWNEEKTVIMRSEAVNVPADDLND